MCLTALNLDMNPMGDEGIAALADGLRWNYSLKASDTHSTPIRQLSDTHPTRSPPSYPYLLPSCTPASHPPPILAVGTWLAAG